MAAAAVAVLPERDARRLTERIRLLAASVQESLEKLAELIAEARDRQVHVTLGYRSWTAYVATEFGQTPLQLDREDRRELVVRLAGMGMSTRAIAPVVGADHVTVARDLSGVSNATPAEPRNVVGLDGKTYAAPAPVPDVVDAEVVNEQPRRRRALPDAAVDAGWEVRKAAERVERILSDDRFSVNKQQVSLALRGHLLFVADSVAAALEKLGNSSTPEG